MPAMLLTGHLPATIRRYAARLVLPALCALLLAACAGPLQTPPADDGLRRAAETQAERLGAEGEHRAAARAWLNLAEAAPAHRQRYQILAAREQQRAGLLAEARALLGQTPLPIQPANRLLWAEVAARILLANDEPARALAELQQVPEQAGPREIATLLGLRAEAQFALRQPAAAVGTLIERETWLSDRESITGNRQRIVDGLAATAAALDAGQLQAARDPLLAGWLELGYLFRTAPPGSPALTAPLAAWRERYPDHPAVSQMFPERRLLPVQLAGPPQRIALLLPLSGRQQPLGEAVRDGFLAAHLTAGASAARVEIGIYDAAALGAGAAYRRAVDDGHQLIVGPLLKDAVEEVAALMDGTPVLSLNALDNQLAAPPGLFQFGLYPEDEAIQVARQAVAAGRKRAVALIPANEWGQRMLASFRQALEEAGGELLDYRIYDTIAADFSFAIQELLLLSESRARHQQLAAILGERPAFSPRRRQDVQFIFLAANAGSGKLIKPQLEFFDAGSLPTYATSAIWEEGSGDNTDLNGVLFPDLPWIIAPESTAAGLRDTVLRHWPGSALGRLRFYALGHDAYRLLPQLVDNPPLGREFNGLTGTLYMGADGRIHRRLPWAQVRNGELVAFGPVSAPTLISQPPADAQATDLLPEPATRPGTP